MVGAIPPVMDTLNPQFVIFFVLPQIVFDGNKFVALLATHAVGVNENGFFVGLRHLGLLVVYYKMQ